MTENTSGDVSLQPVACATPVIEERDCEAPRICVEDVARTFTQPLRGYFARRCRNRADIDDLVQQVMLRIIACEVKAEVCHLGAYVFKTAANVFADQHRRSRVRLADAHVEFDADRHGEIDHDPSHVVEARQALALVNEALAGLPARSQAIFLQRRLENRPYREIAADHCISVSAVEKHMIRSSNHMLAVWGRSLGEAG